MKKLSFSYFSLIKYTFITLCIIFFFIFIIENIKTILLIALIIAPVFIAFYVIRHQLKKLNSLQKAKVFKKIYFSNSQTFSQQKSTQPKQKKQSTFYSRMISKEYETYEHYYVYKKANENKQKQENIKLPSAQESDTIIKERTSNTQQNVANAPSKTYRAKQRLVTKNEETYLKAIKNCIDHNLYDIHTQVALSSIVEKIDHSKYRNELFRSIDFVITNKEQKVFLCIEINDKSHKRYDRQERDRKVQHILQEANIPLLTLWTSYGVNEQYIKKHIDNILQNRS